MRRIVILAKPKASVSRRRTLCTPRTDATLRRRQNGEIQALALFEEESLGRLVANLGGSIVLNRPREEVGGFHGPGVPVLDQSLERLAVEFDQSLLDDGLGLTMALLGSSSW